MLGGCAINGPIYVQTLEPPPVVAQIGEQNTAGAGGGGGAVLFKTLADVDGPFTLAQDGYLVRYIGATQHVYLAAPSSIASAVAPGVAAAIDLTDISDVDTTGIGNNYLLYWDSGTSTWKVRAPYTLADFVFGTPNNGDVVTWDSGDNRAEWAAGGGGSTTPPNVIGRSTGLVTYDTTAGLITTSGTNWVSATTGYAQLQAVATFGSGVETSILIQKNGVTIAGQSNSGMAGASNYLSCISFIVPMVATDQFSYVLGPGLTIANWAIAVWR